MATKRKDAVSLPAQNRNAAVERAIAEAMAKAFCEAGRPTTAAKIERAWADEEQRGVLRYTSGVDTRTYNQRRAADAAKHLDELARIANALADEATEPPVLEAEGYLDFRDVDIVTHDLKILMNALVWYEIHKGHADGDPEPLWALVELIHTLIYLMPPLTQMSRDRDRMTALRENILRPTNRERLDARIAKEIPGYLRDHQREGARGWGVRYVARRLYPILKARGLWTKSEGALRKHLERHHREYFVPF
jgi:hypothetical protein